MPPLTSGNIDPTRFAPDCMWQQKLRQLTKVFSEARIERASSRYKAALYSLALFQLSYPEGSLFGGVPHSPSLAAKSHGRSGNLKTCTQLDHLARTILKQLPGVKKRYSRQQKDSPGPGSNRRPQDTRPCFIVLCSSD